MPAITSRHRGGHIYMPAANLFSKAYTHLRSQLPAAYPVSKAAFLTCSRKSSSYEAERSKFRGKNALLCSCAP